MRRAATLGALLAVVVLAGVTPTAVAYDHQAPVIGLRVGEVAQRGYSYHYWWTEKQSLTTCVAWHANNIQGFPAASPEISSQQQVLRINIWKDKQPSYLALRSWTLVGPSGNAVGPRADVDFTLRKRKTTAGRIYFEVSFRSAWLFENYLELVATWPDTEGCGGEQGGYWTFHYRVLGR